MHSDVLMLSVRVDCLSPCLLFSVDLCCRKITPCLTLSVAGLELRSSRNCGTIEDESNREIWRK